MPAEASARSASGDRPQPGAELPARGQPGVPARGSYARQVVDVIALRSPPQPLELSLAQPFGALFSALLPVDSFRVLDFELQYVNVERLGSSATYSVQVAAASDGGLELRLLVAQGAWLCVQGRARIGLEQGTSGASLGKLDSGQQKRGSSHG
ncbi:MAG TPA: hypothetical protein VFS67_23365 [Polyangiaceae bacterium]|nr:hypothetical protein [Polyangiaceae bacterium]